MSWQARRIEHFYDLDECYRNLLIKQVAAVKSQETARDIVLRNLPKLRHGKLDPARTIMFRLFISELLSKVVYGGQTEFQKAVAV